MTSLINTANAFQTALISKIIKQEIGSNLTKSKFTLSFNSLASILFSCSDSDYLDTNVNNFWYDGNEFQATYF